MDPDLPTQKIGAGGGQMGGGGTIVTQGSAGPPGSLMSVHAGCISDQKKGEWTPTYLCKKIGAGGGVKWEEELL